MYLYACWYEANDLDVVDCLDVLMTTTQILVEVDGYIFPNI